jgi:hypothetical protein
MRNNIKKVAVDSLMCTGAALVLLTIFVRIVIPGGTLLLNTVFEILVANIVINLGLILTRKFESSYAVLEFLLDVSYIVAVLVVSGVIFGWYSTVPIWYLVVMAVAIYAFAVLTSLVRTRKDVKEINELLRKRKKERSDTAS